MKEFVQCLEMAFLLSLGFAAGIVATTLPSEANQATEARVRQALVRYPDEEAIARKACGRHRLMYWWLGDPRAGSAMVHARCAGQVKVNVEVKF